MNMKQKTPKIKPTLGTSNLGLRIIETNKVNVDTKILKGI